MANPIRYAEQSEGTHNCGALSHWWRLWSCKFVILGETRWNSSPVHVLAISLAWRAYKHQEWTCTMSLVVTVAWMECDWQIVLLKSRWNNYEIYNSYIVTGKYQIVKMIPQEQACCISVCQSVRSSLVNHECCRHMSSWKVKTSWNRWTLVYVPPQLFSSVSVSESDSF